MWFLRLCCFFHLLHMKKSDFWVCDEKKNNRDQTPSFVVPWPIKALLDLLKRSALVPCAGLFQPIPVCREQPSIIMSTDNKEFETAAPKHSRPLLSRMQVDEYLDKLEGTSRWRNDPLFSYKYIHNEFHRDNRMTELQDNERIDCTGSFQDVATTATTFDMVTPSRTTPAFCSSEWNSLALL